MYGHCHCHCRYHCCGLFLSWIMNWRTQRKVRRFNPRGKFRFFVCVFAQEYRSYSLNPKLLQENVKKLCTNFTFCFNPWTSRGTFVSRIYWLGPFWQILGHTPCESLRCKIMSVGYAHGPMCGPTPDRQVN